MKKKLIIKRTNNLFTTCKITFRLQNKPKKTKLHNKNTGVQKQSNQSIYLYKNYIKKKTEASSLVK